MSGDRSFGESAADTAVAFGKGLVHGAVESPANAIIQIANQGLKHADARIDLIDVTGYNKKMPENSSELCAAEVGNVLGSIVPLYAINKASGRLFKTSMSAEKTAEILGTGKLGPTLRTNALQGAFTGAAFGTILTPSAEGNDTGEFIANRLKNGAINAAAFSTFQTANAAGRHVLSRNGVFGSMDGRQFLTRELPLAASVGTISGVPTALVQTYSTALAEGRNVTSEEVKHNLASNMLFGGAFAALHQVNMQRVKAAPLTEQQKSEVRWAERTDGKNDDWVPMYERLFPPEEAQQVSVLHENFQGEPVVSGSDRPALGQPKMTIHETYAPNGKLLAASINEVYPGRPSLPGEKGFVLGAYTFVHPELQSTGIGAHHLRNGVIPTLRTEFPAESWQGRLTEIEATDGLTRADQPVRRAFFYRDKIGMQGLNKEQFPYELPLFQPEQAQEAGTYIPQRQIPEYARANNIEGVGEGPVAAEMLYTTFDGQPVSGQQARSMYDRLARWGYGVEPSDPYLSERIGAIDGTAPNLLGPIVLNPEEVATTPFQRALKGLRNSPPNRFLQGVMNSSGSAGAAQRLDNHVDK